MKKNNIDIDSHVNSKLEHFNPQLDNDEIWKNIEPRLKKKKDRKIFIWFFFSGLLAIAVFLGYREMNTGDERAQKVENISLKHNEVKSEKLLDDKEQSNSSTLAEENLIIEKASIESSEKEDQKDRAFNRQAKGEEHSSQRKVKASNSNSIKEGSKLPINLSTNKAEQKILSSNRVILPNGITEKRSSSAPEKVIAASRAESIVEKSFEQEEEQTTSSTIDVLPINLKLLPIEHLALSDYLDKARFVKRRSRIVNKEDRKKIRKRKSWQSQIQFVSGLAYGFESFSANGEPNNSTIALREEVTKQSLSFSSRMSYIHEHKKGLMLISGFEYLQLNESISQNEERTETKLEMVDLTITKDENDNIINSTQGLAEVTYKYTKINVLNNQYRYFNVPLGLGFAMKRKKLSMKYVGGVDFNMSFKFTGSAFDSKGDLIDLESASSQINERYYKTRLGFGLWGGIEWHYAISERISLVVSPLAKVSLKRVSQIETSWFNQNFNVLKLDIGANYLLNNFKKKKKRRTR